MLKRILLFLWILIHQNNFHNVYCSEFTYNGRMGPDHWAEQYNACSGKHQSPININFVDVVKKPFWPIDITRFNTLPLNGSELVNNGHTVLVQLKYDEPPTVADGPLEGKGTYQYSQLHFHWGENNTVGSEDRINNITFPAELHIVFFNSKYASFEEAVAKDDGVTVLAFFFAIQEEDNSHYEEFIQLLDLVREPHTHASFRQPPTLKNLIVKDLNNYFTYTGSLTTPPCNEDVIWIDFVTPIMISAKQIEAFRHLRTYAGKPLTHNFRPIQPLNNRVVYRPSSLPDYIQRSTPTIASFARSNDTNSKNNAATTLAQNAYALLACAAASLLRGQIMDN